MVLIVHLYFVYAIGPFSLSIFNAPTCSNPSRWPALPAGRQPTLEHPMFDLVLVVGAIGLFGLMVAYSYACDRL
ncbi:MAG: hypothetical protein WCJ64_15860 [Rhodospirillaceae bacterium]